MNLDYEKIKQRVEQGGHQWTSYSDLFLVLSVTFLLLYVVASLRSGTSSISQGQQLSEAKAEIEALKKQLSTYEVLKEDYLKQGASKEEVQVYQELMDKLSLLEGAAKEDSERLSREAREAREKKDSLNQYQQLVKNIINANLVSSGKLKKRDTVIAERDKELESLDEQIKVKESLISQNTAEISKIERELERKTATLKRSKESAAELRKLQAESASRIEELKASNEKTYQELSEKNRQTERLVAQLSQKEAQFQSEIENTRRAHEAKLASAKIAFEKGLQSERQYRAEVEARGNEYQKKLQGLKGELESAKEEHQRAASKYQESLGNLEKTNKTLSQNLKASIQKLNEQRQLAKQIQENFARAGVKADVDMKTGEVLIQFGNEYFETDQAGLKPGMRAILEKTFPAYARSLYQDPNIARRLNNVEIVGYASPTYQGKVVDPKSLSAADRMAVNYNMDLSYKRAKSIFEHVFNPDRMQFEHQKRMLPLVKVSGRSYLSADGNSRMPAGTVTSQADYCQKNDCKKSQIVVIKFNLKEEP